MACRDGQAGAVAPGLSYGPRYRWRAFLSGFSELIGCLGAFGGHLRPLSAHSE
jgi:hypothetical protein